MQYAPMAFQSRIVAVGQRWTVGVCVGILLILPGCDSRPTGAPAAAFRTTQPAYDEGSAVQAVFENRTARTVYLHWPGCLLVDLEQLTREGWTKVPLRIVCTAVVRPPRPVPPRLPFHVGIPGRMLADSDVGPGTYRLVVRVAPSESGTSQPKRSNVFRIRARDR